MKDKAAAVVKGVISDESDTEKKAPKPPKFDAPKVVPSPVPAPVAGGEDDFIKVSAVRKIKVTAPPVPADSKPSATTVRSSAQKQTKMRYSRDDELSDSSDDEIGSVSEPMDVIEKSPYELGEDAEKGEALFTRMKETLREEASDDGGTGRVSDTAKQVFGPSNAWNMVKANSLIEKSGMVYSQEWTEGIIRNERIAAPKELILLCLVSSRFAKQGDQLLSGLTRDFGVSSIIAEGLQKLKLDKKYPKIMGVRKNYQFVKRRRDCYKASIFVGRACSCYKAFGSEGPLEQTLREKLVACLDMMEDNLRGDDSKKKRKSSESTSSIPSNVASADSEIPQPPKRKRGRPPKNPRPAPAQLKNDSLDDDLQSETEFNGVLDSPVATAKKKKRKSASMASKKGALAEQSSDEGEDDDDKMYAYNAPSRIKKAQKKTPAAYDESPLKSVTSSLPNLISKFEQQFNEMGRVYRKMGETLEELKSKIQENRTATEEELRAEILAEVQDSLLKSFGKS